MQRIYKYILISLILLVIGWGLSKLAANTKHNAQMVVLNQTGQPIVKIQLKTEKAKQNLHFSGIDTGAELTIHFHNEGEDTSLLFLKLADGKKLVSAPVRIAPGHHIFHTVTRDEIDTHIEQKSTRKE